MGGTASFPFRAISILWPVLYAFLSVTSISHVMCVFFTVNRYFYPSTPSTPGVRADSSILSQGDTRSVVTKNYATEILH